MKKLVGITDQLIGYFITIWHPVRFAVQKLILLHTIMRKVTSEPQSGRVGWLLVLKFTRLINPHYLCILGLLMIFQTGRTQEMKTPLDLEVEKGRALLAEHQVIKRIKLKVEDGKRDTIEIIFYTKEGKVDSILERNVWLSSCTAPSKDFQKWQWKKLFYNAEDNLSEVEYHDGRCFNGNPGKTSHYEYFEEFDEENLIFIYGSKDSLGKIKGKRIFILNEDYQVIQSTWYNQVQSQSSTYQYNEKKQKMKVINNDFHQPRPKIYTFAYYDTGLLKEERVFWYLRDQRMESVYEYVYE